MSEYRWFNAHQPQTLQIAVMLMYLRAVFVLFMGHSWLDVFFTIGFGFGAFGIANEKKWGYLLGVVAAVVWLVYPFALGVGLGDYLRYDPLGLIFSVALVALLVHPMSRDYQRIWFR